GSVLDALEQSGQADRTFVMFLSDHGMPLPFAKTQLYHHSTRTPLMIRWPGVTQDGAIDRRHMVSAVDFIPTLAEVMGFDPPDGLDGRSFADLLRGGSQDGRDYVIKEYNENAGGNRNPMRAIQTKEFLYIFNPWVDGQRVMATATNGTDTFKRMRQLAAHDPVIAARVELMQHRVLEELYDVARDPDCLHNLIDDPEHAEIADRLRAQLLSAMEASADPIADLLRHKDDVQLREAYMQRVQAEADARRGRRRQSKAPSRSDAGAAREGHAGSAQERGP
ncbi:MAG: heparan N-sulfatase, partial [Planctomycetota bacterium]